jgi:hypothetical protein
MYVVAYVGLVAYVPTHRLVPLNSAIQKWEPNESTCSREPLPFSPTKREGHASL